MSMSSRRRRPVLSARPKLGQLPFHRRVVQQARVNDVQAARYLDDEVTERSVWRGLGAAVLEVRDPRNPLPPTEAQCARALKVCSLGIGCLPAGEAPLHGYARRHARLPWPFSSTPAAAWCQLLLCV